MTPALSNRRTFVAALGTVAAGAWALSLTRAAAPASSAAPAARVMRTRPIPRTDESIPVIGLGTWERFDVALDDETTKRLGGVLKAFYAAGGRLVDTSPMYGRAEEVVGSLAAGANLADRLFLATKVWTTGRAEGIKMMETSEKRLRRRHLDLMQVHNMVDAATHLETLAAWKEEGRIRYLGITHHVPSAFDDLEKWMRQAKPDFVQLCYSIGRREAETRLLPLAADQGIAIIVNRPFDKGAHFKAVEGKPLPAWAAEADCATWAQLFLKFILSNPAVTCVIPATGNPDHLAENVAAGFGEPLSAEHRSRLLAMF
jgi:diketogulonate reductase-like aldo/keto reductase